MRTGEINMMKHDSSFERQEKVLRTFRSIGRLRNRRERARRAALQAGPRVETPEQGRSRAGEGRRLGRLGLGYLDWELGSDRSWWSDEIFRIFGFEPGEVEPTLDRMRQLVLPEDQAELGRTVAETIRSGEPQLLNCRIIRADGELRHLTGRMNVIPARHGEPARLVSTLQDVTEQQRIEDELRRSRATLTAGQRIARLGTWDWDMKTDQAWWSDELVRILEPDPDVTEVSFETFLERFDPADRKLAEDAIRRAVEQQEPFDLELRLPVSDGASRVIHASGEVIHDDDGSPWRLLGVVQDITDRKRIEDELRRARASLEAGQQVAGLGTWDWDLKTNELWWSAEVDRLFGQEVGGVEPSFEMLLKAVHPDDLTALMEAIQAPPAEPGPSDLEVRIVASDGSIRNALSRGQTFFDDDGTPVRMVGAFQDITERKRNEDELRRNRTLLETGQQIAGLGTWEWTFTDGSLWWSDEVYRIFGYEPGEFDATYERFVQAIHPDDRDGLVSLLDSTVASGEPYSAEMRIVRADESVRVILARGETICNARQQPERMVGAVQDITERKQIEQDLAVARDQALEASRQKSEFLATMSHEIRTPMNGVLGMLDLLLDTPLSPQQKDFTLSARDSAISLLAIINDVLDFSRIEAGKMLIDRTDFELATIVEGAAEILAGPARERRNSLMTYVDPAIPRVLQGDPGRLRQVLVNLCGNAVKFTEGGEVTVRAMLDSADDTEATVRFSVSDTGIGMSADVKDRLFQAFTQADATTTRRYGGTGLGLAIARQLVELMGGTIDVESEVGKGSTFWFTVPFDVSTSEVPKPLRIVDRDLTDIRVLVADSNTTSREIVHRYILSWGMRNGSVPDASGALAALRRAVADDDPYDVVILDMGASGVSNSELAKRIQADPAIAGTPLILLAAFDQPGGCDRALDEGFSAYLTRPVRNSQLFDAIVNAMARPEGEHLDDDTGRSKQAPGASAVDRHAPDTAAVVLIAEDNPVNQKVARMQVERLGYRVEVVENGRQAVEAMASSDRYALVFMDVQMPELDGFGATRAIRRAEMASGRRTPIIAMTANALEGDREECLAAGMDDYLSKPVSRNKLREVLERWLPNAPERVEPDPS